MEQMSERARTIDLTIPVERAFVIGLDDPSDTRWPVGRSLAELGALAETAGATVVEIVARGSHEELIDGTEQA